jgi:hypothetical protein
MYPILRYIDNFLDGLVPYYIYVIAFFHLAYVGVFIGLVELNEKYLNILDIFIQTFICFFLIIRFNPFRKHVFRPSDADVIFGSAIFLLLNLGFVKLFNQTARNEVDDVLKESGIKQSSTNPDQQKNLL